tara:strand:+ start:5291 stop:6241 length:951 start_codon:yes stop_codon:yes gene_type:complete
MKPDPAMETLAFDLRKALGGAPSLLYTDSHPLDSAEAARAHRINTRRDTAPVSGPGWRNSAEDDSAITDCLGPFELVAFLLHETINGGIGRTNSWLAWIIDLADRSFAITTSVFSVVMTYLIVIFNSSHVFNIKDDDFMDLFGIFVFAAFAVTTLCGIVSSQGHRFELLIYQSRGKVLQEIKWLQTDKIEENSRYRRVVSLIYWDDMRQPFYTWAQCLTVLSVYAFASAHAAFVLLHTIIQLMHHYDRIWFLALAAFALSCMFTSLAHATRFDMFKAPPEAYTFWPFRMSAYRCALGIFLVPVLTLGAMVQALMPR